MFTTIDKAIVAFLGAVVFLVAQYTDLDLGFISEEMIQSIAAVVTPLLVWAIPNKEV